MSPEQIAHDLAIAFVTYKLNLEMHQTDAECGKEAFFNKYTKAYTCFFEMITEGQ